MAKKSKMKEIWAQMEKNYGNDGLCKTLFDVEVIPTGSLALDDATGIWGLPKGKIVQYAGKESSGKTLMSLVAIREWQKLNPENWAIFIDAEFSFSPSWAQKLGVDVERLYLIREESAVEIFTQLCGIPNKELGKPKSKPGILDLEKDEPSGLGLIVLDSIAQMQPPIEQTKQVGNTNIASFGRFLPDALRRLKPLLSQTGVTLIAINQIRVDIGKMFGDPTSTPGGKAWKHGCDMMVHFTMSESKKSYFFDDRDEPYGHVAGARIDKNKLAMPRRMCNFALHYEHGVVDRHIEVGQLAIKYGVIKRPNNKSYVYGEKTWVGKDNFFAAIEKEGLVDKLFAEVHEAKNSLVAMNPEDFNLEEEE
jgi:recombination protein RecA